jgi:glycosyltransferase involved in cell wall biosynthesis
VLGVGTLEPRKNLERLIEAWAGMQSEEYELVLVGSIGWDAGAILRRARRRRVRLLGYVNDDDLVALYSLCEAFCYPSLYEGFGLPVLEAMAAGAPVITSSVSSLPEVAGDAAVLVDPRDAQAIRAGLERVLSDARERERLRIAGRARAAQFSWDQTARLTRDVFLRIARQV